MSLALFGIAEAATLAASLSIDTFTAGFAYGSKKIKLPVLSAQIITFICSGVTGLACLAGSAVSHLLPRWITITASFTILFVIGLVKLLDSITKSVIRKHSDISKEIKISLFNFKFILRLYADPEKADIDESKTISSGEAAALALSLSLDGIAAGFGSALTNTNGLMLFLCSLVANTSAIILGCHTGNKVAGVINHNISWISGVTLIIMAFLKFL